MGDVTDSVVGFLEAKYVDQIRNHMGVGLVIDQAKLKADPLHYGLGLVAQRNANGSLQDIISKQVYKSPTQTSGQAVPNMLISASQLCKAFGGAAFPMGITLFYAGWIGSVFTGSANASVTLVVLNLGDEPLELQEEPYNPHGYPSVQPAVMGASKLDPPNKPSGATGPLTAWICSPIQEGLAGWASVGIWRFDHATSAMFTNVSGTLRLSYKKYGVNVLLGGQWPLNTIFTDYKDTFSAALDDTGKVTPQQFFDDHVDGKNSSKLVQASLTNDKGSFSIAAGDENSFYTSNTPGDAKDYFVVMIVDGKGSI